MLYPNIAKIIWLQRFARITMLHMALEGTARKILFLIEIKVEAATFSSDICSLEVNTKSLCWRKMRRS